VLRPRPSRVLLLLPTSPPALDPRAQPPTYPFPHRYGAVLSLGAGATGFLHKKHWAAETKPPPRWRPVLAATLSPTERGRPMQLGSVSATRKPLGVNAPLGFDNLVPGLLVNASVAGVLADGVRVSFCGGFEGSIAASQLGPLAGPNWAKEVATGSKLLTRLLWLNPAKKTAALSHVEHLTAVESAYAPPALAGEHVRCRVLLVTKEGAVVACAKTSQEADEEGDDKEEESGELNARGWLGPADVLDLQTGQKPADSLRKLSAGASLSAVVTGVDSLAGRLLLSGRASVLKRAAPPVEPPSAGDVVEATVIRLGPTGARLRLGGAVGGSLLGRVPRAHISDEVSLKKPEATLKLGQPVRALVLQAAAAAGAESDDPSSSSSPAAVPMLTLSLKPSLVESTLPRYAAYADAAAGTSSHGVVESVKPTAVLVSFLNGVKGVVYGSELRATLGAVWDADPLSCYAVGQALKARVLRCEPTKARLVLSLLSAEEAATKPAALAAPGAERGAAAAYPPGAAVALRAGELVHGSVAGWQDAAAKKEAGGGEAGVWVALDAGGHGWLPLSQLGDVGALLPLWKSALQPGARLPPLLVLLVQPKALGGTGRATLSAKPSLHAALAAGRLPTSAAEAGAGGRQLLCGWVAKLKRDGAYIGFAGSLRGYAPAAAISDASSDALALLSPGQSVLALSSGVADAAAGERTLALSLRHDALCTAAEAEAAAGMPAAAAAAGLAAAAAEAAGPALPPLCGSFLAERWGVAAARAAAAEGDAREEDEEDEEERAEAAAEVAAALGSASDDGLSTETLRALRSLRVGALVELTKAGSSLVASLPGGITVSARSEAALKLKKGEAARAVVLDADPLGGCVHVSAEPELVAAAEADAADAAPKKKKRAAEAASAAAEGLLRLRVGAKVTGEVVLSRPGLLVLSLPKFGRALGVASHHALWSAAGASAEALAAEASRYATGQKVKLIVAALPEEAADDADAETPPSPLPLLLSVVGAPVASAAGAPAGASVSSAKTGRVLGPIRRAADARPGAHALAKVVGVSATEMTLVLDKKGAVRGRVHLTELVAAGQQATLPASAPAEPIHVVVLGGGKGAPVGGVIECTMRPADVSGGSGRGAPRTSTAELVPGQIVTGWVRDATDKAVWVCLSHRSTGRLPAAEASSDAAVVADLAAHFKVGMPLTARVVSVKSADAEGGSKLRLTLSLFLNPEASAANRAALEAAGGGADGEVAEAPAEGTIVRVHIKCLRPGRGADVTLEGGVVGRVHITEVCDAWEAAPLQLLAKAKRLKGAAATGKTEVTGSAAKKAHKAVVLRTGVGDKGKARVEVSLRASSLKAYGDAPGEHARPMFASELSEGALVRGYVKEASARGAFISLSRELEGFVALRLLSDGFVDKDEVAALLPVGTLVVARVVKLAEGGANALPSLSLRQSDVEGGAMKKKLRFEDLSAGLVLSGVVRKVVCIYIYIYI